MCAVGLCVFIALRQVGTGRLMRRRAGCVEAGQGAGNTHPLGEFPTHFLAETLSLVGTDVWAGHAAPLWRTGGKVCACVCVRGRLSNYNKNNNNNYQK